jgi:hypothetical protein
MYFMWSFLLYANIIPRQPVSDGASDGGWRATEPAVPAVPGEWLVYWTELSYPPGVTLLLFLSSLLDITGFFQLLAHPPTPLGPSLTPVLIDARQLRWEDRPACSS